ncbi:MAG: Ppx/GppA family phosphatase [Rhizobiaceae bacterium]|nr:Ppx/GppA family phosphatase [Rhizobiaceae bacterium]
MAARSVLRVRAAAEGLNVEHRETGAVPDRVGVASPQKAGESSRSDGAGGGHKPGRGAQPSPARKRRKRRRGRKVFDRSDAAVETERESGEIASQPEAPIIGGVSAIAVPGLAARSHGRDLPVFAALDLGTNNCRLLIAVPGRPGQFRVIDAFSRIVRLGEGLSLTGKLSASAMNRAVDALRICADKLGSREIARARLIATEACRAANNGDEFLALVKAETGLSLEVIDRRTEARLAVAGCSSLVGRETDGLVLFDIGGGSSEIALIDMSRRRSSRLANHIVSWTSLPVGVVSLSERFGGRAVTRDVYAAMVDYVGSLLGRFEGRRRIDHLVKGDRFHLLGTSGTVTTLAGVHLGLDRYDRRKVDGLWMDRVNVDLMIETLLSWDFDQRVANPCIGSDRADLVMAGCAILDAIRQVWPSERLRVADRGLREGILNELMADGGAWRGHGRHSGSAE